MTDFRRALQAVTSFTWTDPAFAWTREVHVDYARRAKCSFAVGRESLLLVADEEAELRPAPLPLDTMVAGLMEKPSFQTLVSGADLRKAIETGSRRVYFVPGPENEAARGAQAEYFAPLLDLLSPGATYRLRVSEEAEGALVISPARKPVWSFAVLTTTPSDMEDDAPAFLLAGSDRYLVPWIQFSLF